eukprot:COSAG02_NODE_30643_length_547_cov_1.263393_1_plen_104_part_10
MYMTICIQDASECRQQENEKILLSVICVNIHGSRSPSLTGSLKNSPSATGQLPSQFNSELGGHRHAMQFPPHARTLTASHPAFPRHPVPASIRARFGAGDISSA